MKYLISFLLLVFCLASAERLLAQGPPAAPPAAGGGTLPPNPDTEVSQTHECGYTVLKATSTPPGGYAWYWQTSRDGTSTTHSASNNSPYNATSTSATYYIRTYYSPSETWSDEYESLRVQVNSGFRVKPANPVITEDRHCGSTALLAENPSTSITWYWQTSDSPSSYQVNNDSSVLSRTTAGTVYLRAKHNSNGCWSDGTTSKYYTVREIPEYPPAPVETNNGGNTLLTAATPTDPNVRFYWQTEPDGTSQANDDKEYTVYSGNQVWLRAFNKLSSNECWSGTRLVNYQILYSPAPPTYIGSSECGKTTYRMDLEELNSRGNEEWYWQTDEYGTSQDDDSPEKVITQVEGKPSLYLRAKKRNHNIWSSTTVIHRYIKKNPSTPLASDKEACFGQDVTTLSASSSEEGVTLEWYRYPGSGSIIKTGSTLSINDISENETYYVGGYKDSCRSIIRRKVEAKIVEYPERELNYKIQKMNELPCTELYVINLEGQQDNPYYFLGENPNGEVKTFNSPTISSSGTYYFAQGNGAADPANACLSIPVSETFDMGVPPDMKTVVGGGRIMDHPYSYNKIHVINASEDTYYHISDGSGQVDVFKGDTRNASVDLENGNYSVQASHYLNNSPIECLTDLGEVEITEGHLTLSTRSYNSVETYLTPTEEADISSSLDSDVIKSTTYRDDYGRPIQSIVENASPDGRDIIQSQSYDALGRTPKVYLPYAAAYNGTYHSGASAWNDQVEFYTTESGVAHDARPYSEMTFDDSPMNRVKTMTGPGEDWKDNDRKVRNEQLNNTLSDDVIHWEVIDGQIANVGSYAPGLLIKQVTYTEDNQTKIVFINKSGQAILKREQAPSIDGGWADTYSIYDEYGNVVAVIPPKALENLNK
ncbi:DUF6443 domain-containing protein [Reichenbachiella sp.]|uniref:DUF6443 domain-containing protein n=1 Tax=Reichenbachiella sp. TaxID=2184521 RepID=UPI003BB19BAE